MTRVLSARLLEPCLIEDRVSWGTTFNAGVDELKQTWDLALDERGWLRITQIDKNKTVTSARIPPTMIRIVFDEPEPVPTDPREVPTDPDIKPLPPPAPAGIDPNWRHPKAKRP